MSTASMPSRRSISARMPSVHGSAPKMPIRIAVLARIDALALELVGDRQHVGGRHQHHARAELADQLDLPLAEAARHRHHRAAQPLGAVVRAQPAGEQAVAVGVVDDVARPRPAGVERARHQVGPQIDVARRVADHRRPPRRAARGMDAHALLARDGEHAEGIGVAQVGLRGEGKAPAGLPAGADRRDGCRPPRTWRDTAPGCRRRDASALRRRSSCRLRKASSETAVSGNMPT